MRRISADQRLSITRLRCRRFETAECDHRLKTARVLTEGRAAIPAGAEAGKLTRTEDEADDRRPFRQPVHTVRTEEEERGT
jgi:hypothetical protein